MQGVVKFFDQTRGFGFITRADGGGDVFVHISEVKRAGIVNLAAFDELEFVLKNDPRGGICASSLVLLTSRAGGASA